MVRAMGFRIPLFVPGYLLIVDLESFVGRLNMKRNRMGRTKDDSIQMSMCCAHIIR